MWLRKALAGLIGGAALLAGVTATSEAQAGHTINIGTLAPAESIWGDTFRAWSSHVAEKSDNQLDLNWAFNGTAGDEKTMVDKMKGGQLDGAAVTSVGLSYINPDMLALQMPGLFDSWAKLDSVRAQMLPKFLIGISAKGFKLVGIGDVGRARTFSNKAIRTPADLRSAKVYRWKDDNAAAVMAQVIGYTAVPESVPGLKSALKTKRIDTLTVPALPLVSLLWHEDVTHATANTVGFGIGGLVFRQGSLDNLPPDLAELLRTSGGKAGRYLTKQIRQKDQAVWEENLAPRLTVVSLTDAEKAEWTKTFKEVRERLSQGTFRADLVVELECRAGKRSGGECSAY